MIENTIISIIGVIFTFGIVIFIHEFGHFIVSKLLGVYIEEFSFGFGKSLFQKKIRETLYSIRLIPLGGYVKPKGEDINEYKGEADEYFSKKWYERSLIVLAGPFMNYFLSFIIFFLVIFISGKPVPSDSTKIGSIATGYPAYNSGLKENDRIVSINSKKVSTWKEMSQIIHSNVEKEIVIEYERDGEVKKVALKTIKDPALNRGIIGIAPQTVYEKVGLVKSLKYSLYQLWYWTDMTLKTILHSIIKMEKPDLAGPIGIVSVVSKAAHSDLADFFFLVGLISIAVGFFNLLPLPLLDGGHFVLYLFEGVFRKKITPAIMRYVQNTGIVILISILIFATYNDIMRIYNSKIEKEKIQKVNNPQGK